MNNALARWERYSPVGIGMEDMFRRLDALADSGTNFPPYNIVRFTEDDGTELNQLQIALAGYDKDSIEVAVERNVLSVSYPQAIECDGEYVHKGIAQRSFARNWQLNGDAKVSDVTYKNGMLYIDLVKEVPEEHKRKLLPIK